MKSNTDKHRICLEIVIFFSSAANRTVQKQSVSSSMQGNATSGTLKNCNTGCSHYKHIAACLSCNILRFLRKSTGLFNVCIVKTRNIFTCTSKLVCSSKTPYLDNLNSGCPLYPTCQYCLPVYSYWTRVVPSHYGSAEGLRSRQVTSLMLWTLDVHCAGDYLHCYCCYHYFQYYQYYQLVKV